jgi:GDP-L-fucose synthase
MADACVHVMGLDAETYRGATEVMLSHVNVGTGTDCSIAELAQLVAAATGFEGEIRFDPSKPDGTPRKLLDVGRLTALGWTSTIPLEQGLKDTYDWYAAQEAVRGR